MLRIKIILDEKRLENHPRLIEKLEKALKDAGYTQERGFQEHTSKKEETKLGVRDILIETVDKAPDDISVFLEESAVLVTEALWFAENYNEEDVEPHQQVVLIHDPVTFLGDLQNNSADSNVRTICWSDNLDDNIAEVVKEIKSGVAKRFSASIAHIVVIDDDINDIVGLIQACLDVMGFPEHGRYNVRHFHYRKHSDTEGVLETLKRLLEFGTPVIVISDVYMASRYVEGMELAGKIFDQFRVVPVILLSQYGTGELMKYYPTAADKFRELKKKGGYLFYTIPKKYFKPEDIKNPNSRISKLKKRIDDYLDEKRFNIARIICDIPERIDWKEAVKFQRRENIQTDSKDEGIIAVSSGMEEIIKLIKQYANKEDHVLLLGETGTGKGLVAKAIHYSGVRKDKPFWRRNCAGLSEELLESELFGHEKGAFTGATADKPGLFERANGGTLFLDEVGEMSTSIQAKLLTALEEKKIVYVGGTKSIDVDVRIICATNRNLREEIKKYKNDNKEGFRDDLYYRLNKCPLELPPLHERKLDIPYLIGYYLRDTSNITGISEKALRLLLAFNYPGNVRELETLVVSLPREMDPPKGVVVGSHVYKAFDRYLRQGDKPIADDDDENWVLNAEEINDLGREVTPTKTYEFVRRPSSSEVEGIEAEQAAQYRQDVDSQSLITEYKKKFRQGIELFDLLLENIPEAKAKLDITQASFMDKAIAIIDACNNAEYYQRRDEIETEIRKHFVDKQSGLSILYHISERFNLDLPERPRSKMPDEVKCTIVEIWDWIYENRTDTDFDSLLKRSKKQPQSTKQPWIPIIFGKGQKTLERYKKQISE